MSDQERNRGHHIITAHAVKELFQAIPSEKLLGLSPQEFFQKLDAAQAHADRSPVGPLLEFKPLFGLPADVSPIGIGDTWLSSRDAPEAQMRHAVANPAWDAQTNLAAMKVFVVDELMAAQAAHDRGDADAQWHHLGAAVHCLEDSYSGAHIFRDPQQPGDPAAAIKGINNFTWKSETRTHDGDFDRVPVNLLDLSLARASDQAAASAVRELVTVFVQHVDSSDPATLRHEFEAKADKFFHGPDALVLDHRDEVWAHQHAAHYANEASLGTAPPVHAEPNSTEAVIMSLPADSTMAPVPGENTAHAGDKHYVHPTGGVETSISKHSHGKTYEIWGRDPKEHAADQRFHSWEHINGKDILCPVGTPIYAVADGVISGGFGASKSNDKQLEGQRLHLKSDDNTFFYAHMSQLADGIARGTHVHKGDLLGYSGSAGNIPHLHFAAEKPDTTLAVLHAAQVMPDVSPPHETLVPHFVSHLPAPHTPTEANLTHPHGHAIHVDPHSAGPDAGLLPVDAAPGHHGTDPHHAQHSHDRPVPESTSVEPNYTDQFGQVIHVNPDSAQFDPHTLHADSHSVHADPQIGHGDGPAPDVSAAPEPTHPSQDVDPGNVH